MSRRYPSHIFPNDINNCIYLFLKTVEDVNQAEASLGPSAHNLDQKSGDRLRVPTSEGVKRVGRDRPVHDDDQKNVELWRVESGSRVRVGPSQSVLLVDQENDELWPAMQIRENARRAGHGPLVHHHAQEREDLWLGNSVKRAKVCLGPLVHHVSRTTEDLWSEMQIAKSVSRADRHQVALFKEVVPVHAVLHRKVLREVECLVLLVLTKESKGHLVQAVLLFKMNVLAKRGKCVVVFT